MKSLKEIQQLSKQKTYVLGKVFAEGDWVENVNGDVGKIHRRGVNYIIAVTEDGKMFRAWVKDLKEYCGNENTYMSPKQKVKAFINKNKRKENNDD